MTLTASEEEEAIKKTYIILTLYSINLKKSQFP